MFAKAFFFSIKGRLIALVAFFMIVLLGFSLVMLYRNSQVEQDVEHFLEVRTRTRSATEDVRFTISNILSKTRRDILKQVPLSYEQDLATIHKEFGVLDSLSVYLDDTGRERLQSLIPELVDYERNLQRADSIWSSHLTQKVASRVRLYAVDPHTTVFRVISEVDAKYQLSSDTIAETIVEAEDGFCSGAFMNYSHDGYQGRGYIDYVNNSDDFIEWKFSTQWSGRHILSFRYANGGSADRPLQLTVNGTPTDSLYPFPPAERRNWTSWMDTEAIIIPLERGVHTIRATATGKSGANIDYLKIVAPAPYLDSMTLPIITRREGVIDEMAASRIADKTVRENRSMDAMNGVEDLVRNATTSFERKLGPVEEANQLLLEREVTRLKWQLQKANIFNFATLAIVAVLAIVATYFVLRSLKKSISRPVEQIRQLSLGETNLALRETNDELDAVIQVSNRLAQNLNRASDFAHEIGEGNLQHKFSPASEHDVLGNALIQMRNKLLAVTEEEQKRHWYNDGINQLTDLLRKEQDDRYELGAHVISSLVKYVGANQGGLFYYNEQEESRYLELIGCYAYNRRKYVKKNVMVSEGLLGQAFLEGETTYLTEIPEDYITIRSGLGESPPKSLLIVPLKTDQQTEGTIELASFHEFPDHKIAFVEKSAEIIAAHLSGLRMSEHTQILLKETQQQASQLREQEEELRQNMEEMQATQEQLRRDERES